MHNGTTDSVMNFVSDSIIVMDEKGTVTSINPAAGNLFGYLGSEVIGEHVSLLLPELFVDSTLTPKAKISETGKKSTGKKKSGSIFPITITVVESSSVEGRLFIGIIREIVERKPWENPQYLKLILDHIPDKIWVKDLQSKYIFGNRAFMQDFDKKTVKVEGLTDRDLFSADVAEQQELQDQEVLRTEEGIVYKKKIEQEEGTTALRKLTKTPLKDHSGQVWGILGVDQDITEWQQTEELVTHLGKILDETIFEIYVFSSFPLQFLYMNQCALKNLGYSMEEITALSPIQLWSKYSDESFQLMLDSILLGEQETFQFETNHRRRNGSNYPIDVKIQLISEKDKAPLFMAVAQDSSPRKEAEAIQRKAERALLYSNFVID
ncbi:PAS domain S-box protein [Ammoniphilus sp. CFH 90114]|uniref:PAS domain S-box protein n=1 Tax=Ammoniphilus sp. CFH 90114 TaxID=2493665 RepID=UPI00100DEAC3|nr:PAS domain S-box protein [Ammoniphilus sp. CFH 90114]RXT04866.1 PAS domain S-box protein [Ammoniphilus sp. CFH 90114]